MAPLIIQLLEGLDGRLAIPSVFAVLLCALSHLRMGLVSIDIRTIGVEIYISGYIMSLDWLADIASILMILDWLAGIASIHDQNWRT